MRRRDSKSSKASNEGMDSLRDQAQPTQSANAARMQQNLAPPATAADPKEGEDAMSATSDFVKKLYK